MQEKIRSDVEDQRKCCREGEVRKKSKQNGAWKISEVMRFKLVVIVNKLVNVCIINGSFHISV